MSFLSWRVLGVVGVMAAVAACGGSSGGRMKTPAPPVAADLFEPNDVQGSCSSVVLDFSEASLSLHAAGDEDYFCFVLGLDSDVTAMATFDVSAGDVELELLDSVGMSITTGQADPGGRVLLAPVTCGVFAARVVSCRVDADVCPGHHRGGDGDIPGEGPPGAQR